MYCSIIQSIIPIVFPRILSAFQKFWSLLDILGAFLLFSVPWSTQNFRIFYKISEFFDLAIT